MNIYDLQNERGDVVELLGIDRDEHGFADLSSLDWANALIVLRGLTFHGIKLEGIEIKPKLVECHIEGSLFNVISSCAHLSGAGSRWIRTRFSNMQLLEINSPQCRFEDCSFENVSLTNYRPCETVFSRCIFNQVSFVGMKSVNRSRLAPFPELDALGANAAFMSCEFQKSTFENCYFHKIGFSNCKLSGVSARQCDFTGIISDVSWWEGGSSGDPFVSFLDEILSLIRDRLGAQSTAFQAMLTYRADYAAGRTTSRDYSACLFDGRVSFQDVEKIEEDLYAIHARYPE